MKKTKKRFVRKEIRCEICNEFLGSTVDYDNEYPDVAERISASMGDYYDRRWHYEDKHNMDTDTARGYAL